jgi:hypothetical protein
MDGVTLTNDDIARLIEEKNRLVRENYEMRRLVEALADRVREQPELPPKKAEAKE